MNGIIYYVLSWVLFLFMQHNICDIHVVFPSYLSKSALLYEWTQFVDQFTYHWPLSKSWTTVSQLEVEETCLKKNNTKLSEPLSLFRRRISRIGNICRRQISRMGNYKIELFHRFLIHTVKWGPRWSSPGYSPTHGVWKSLSHNTINGIFDKDALTRNCSF